MGYFVNIFCIKFMFEIGDDVVVFGVGDVEV